MALNEDKIKDLFSSKLGGFEPELPASIWGGLDQLLSQQTAPTPDAPSMTSQGGPTVAKASALKASLVAAGVAASVALGVYLAYDAPAVAIPEAVVEEPTKVVAPVDEVIGQNTLVLAVADFVAPRAIPKTIVATATIEKEEVEKAVEKEKEEEKVIEKVQVKKAPKELIVEEEMIPALEMPKFFKEDISLALNSNIGALSGNKTETGGGLLFSKDDRSDGFLDVLKGEQKQYKLKHKQPISFGLTVSKKLTRNVSLETGLVFTYLSSEITSNSASNIKEEQKFGYLGIPIKLNYQFYEWHKTKIYVSLGATIQKDVFGQYTSKLKSGTNLLNMIGTNHDLTNSDLPHTLYAEPSYIKKNINQSNWQFSGGLSIGASYPIYRWLHIHGSVGGAYYFDANNEYRTIFSDRKLQLDLNMGLKFDF